MPRVKDAPRKLNAFGRSVAICLKCRYFGHHHWYPAPNPEGEKCMLPGVCGKEITTWKLVT